MIWLKAIAVILTDWRVLCRGRDQRMKWSSWRSMTSAVIVSVWLFCVILILSINQTVHHLHLWWWLSMWLSWKS